jgi:GNAT superfamily N-acetyltransferase
MIRKAEEKDLRRIMEMSNRFYPHTSYWTVSQIPLDEEPLAAFVLSLIDNGIFYVAEVDDVVVGMIGLIVVPFLFNPNYLTAGEVIWWVEPEYWNKGIGEQLLLVVEEPCREAGVKHIQMIDVSVSAEWAEKVYRKHGYLLTERSWTKVV